MGGKSLCNGDQTNVGKRNDDDAASQKEKIEIEFKNWNSRLVILKDSNHTKTDTNNILTEYSYFIQSTTQPHGCKIQFCICLHVHIHT